MPGPAPTMLSVAQVLHVCSTLLLMLLAYFGSTLVTRTDRLEQRQVAHDVLLSGIETWQRRAMRDTDLDHAALVQLASDVRQREVVLEQAVALMRDLKGVIDNLSVKHIEIRERLLGVEQQTKRRESEMSRR